MNIIISCAGLEDNQELLKSRRPFAMQPVAGSTILGHILERLQDAAAHSIVVVVNSGAEAVRMWAQQFLADGLLQVVSIKNREPSIMALDGCRQFLTADPLLFVSGGFISEADYNGLASEEAEVACLIQDGQEIIPASRWFIDDAGYYSSNNGQLEVSWAGACWFRRGTDLLKAISSSAADDITDMPTLLASLSKQGLHIATREADTCLGTVSPAQLLHANARLMQLGYCSDDAIERSYAEEFTVLPPVFLHETAVIENAVVGPFVNLEADAVVSNSVLRNCLIGVGTRIEDMVLDGSLIGDHAHVNGQRQTVIVGDGSQLELD